MRLNEHYPTLNKPNNGDTNLQSLKKFENTLTCNIPKKVLYQY